MGLYERYGKRLGFWQKYKAFFYVNLVIIPLIIILFLYGIFYDIPETLKPAKCTQFVVDSEPHFNLVCEVCRQKEIQRTAGGIPIIANLTSNNTSDNFTFNVR